MLYKFEISWQSQQIPQQTKLVMRFRFSLSTKYHQYRHHPPLAFFFFFYNVYNNKTIKQGRDIMRGTRHATHAILCSFSPVTFACTKQLEKLCTATASSTTREWSTTELSNCQYQNCAQSKHVWCVRTVAVYMMGYWARLNFMYKQLSLGWKENWAVSLMVFPLSLCIAQCISFENA